MYGTSQEEEEEEKRCSTIATRTLPVADGCPIRLEPPHFSPPSGECFPRSLLLVTESVRTDEPTNHLDEASVEALAAAGMYMCISSFLRVAFVQGLTLETSGDHLESAGLGPRPSSRILSNSRTAGEAGGLDEKCGVVETCWVVQDARLPCDKSMNKQPQKNFSFAAT